MYHEPRPWVVHLAGEPDVVDACVILYRRWVPAAAGYSVCGELVKCACDGRSAVVGDGVMFFFCCLQQYQDCLRVLSWLSKVQLQR